MKTTKLTADLLDIYQTAHLLGVSASTVYQWSSRGYMPLPVRFGGRRRWRHSELREWAEAGFPQQELQHREEANTCQRPAKS